MRIAICEEDEIELGRILELILEYRSEQDATLEYHCFNNSTDFLDAVKDREYDLVLLDVLMQGVTGMQAAQELREWDKYIKIIFISSSPEFAMESYSVEAYHYLLKPIEGDSLFRLLEKVKRELAEEEGQGIILRSRRGIVRVLFSEIEYIEVINKTVSFHLADSIIYEVTAALTDFEGKFLVRQEFFKPHRSYLINLHYVQAINAYHVITVNGHSIPVSRRRYNELQDTYMHFWLRGKGAGAEPENLKGVDGEPKSVDVPWRILLVDDDPVECAFWADMLRDHGCVVQLAKSGEEALKLAAGCVFDCVLLDVMLPGEDGFSICRRLCGIIQAPVIFLSSHTESEKQLQGFALGGVDYITKDTSAELVWAKVKTRIRLADIDRSRFCYGALILDLKERRVLIEGKELDLTPIEFDIMWKLSENTGHTFTPEEIFAVIWGGKTWDGGKMVQSHMSRLRRKLERAYGEHCFIETVWGEGYRFVP